MPPKKKVTKKKVSDETTESTDIHDVTTAAHGTGDHDQGEEHVLLHLPIHSDRLAELTYMDNILEYNPILHDPTPYDPSDQFVSGHDVILSDASVKVTTDVTPVATQDVAAAAKETTKEQAKCFWCCHDVGHEVFGMPIRYDALNKNFGVYGTFCSLECASAFNFAQHLGSDRAWEIHSWIQMLGKRFGYKEPIRPAPSRYLLKMFNGPLSIEDFRNAHKGQTRTLVMNIPPLISVPSQLEMINTSFLGTAQTEKKKRAPVVEKKKTIDTKMKLLIEEST